MLGSIAFMIASLPAAPIHDQARIVARNRADPATPCRPSQLGNFMGQLRTANKRHLRALRRKLLQTTETQNMPPAAKGKTAS